MTGSYDNHALQNVLPFWFGDVSGPVPFDMGSIQMQRWYGKSPEIDAEIKETFEDLYLSLVALNGSEVLSNLTTDDLLAALIVVDQFPRNMYRDTSRMYDADALGLELATVLEQRADFGNLDIFRQLFALVPFMHAENLAAQTRMLGHFETFPNVVAERGWPNDGFFKNALIFARRHHEIIEMFGRFPHRNEILDRVSTADEIAFLKSPDSGF